ncbi:MAG TPA: hypothetical protein VG870_11995 [Chitinophagaceae bacterium]|nr:hypothetical protein [Chitinophagaceae bacterium]
MPDNHIFSSRPPLLGLALLGLISLGCRDGAGRQAGNGLAEGPQAVRTDTAHLPHYDLAHPGVRYLGEKLREISGIYYLAGTQTMLAENDEQGRIFTLSLADTVSETYPSLHFGPKDDYEDITLADTTAYLLISDGEIVEVPGYAQGAEHTGRIVGQLGGTHNEFETLYYDPGRRLLVMICKSCHHEKDQFRTAYGFDPRSRKFGDSALFRISIPAIRQRLGDPDARFFPSAAAIHPLQKRLYILSSIGKLLVVTTLDGEVLGAYRLDPALYRQPEGITFAPNGNMYISNEGGDGRATLLTFPYQP